MLRKLFLTGTTLVLTAAAPSSNSRRHPDTWPFLAMSRDSDEATKVDWSLGDIAYAMADNLSVRVEYRYADLGKPEARASDNLERRAFTWNHSGALSL